MNNLVNYFTDYMNTFKQHNRYQGKSSWPELLGVPGDVAVATIQRENPLVTAIILPPGTRATNNFKCNRVWVPVDGNGKVVKVPIIG
ncbi:hypothetical protein Pfo_029199 [Paulownia fortunei]|nr:hypothetical protein Pfo_029199 [Paulownia fortunei]